jgi:hypothetical protein
MFRVIPLSLCALALAPAVVLGVGFGSADGAPFEKRPAIVYQACMDTQGMVTRYDCRCLKEKYNAELTEELKKPEYVPPTQPSQPPKTPEEAMKQLQAARGQDRRTTQTQVLIKRVMNRGECRSEQAFARYNQNECERRFHITKRLSNLPENTDKERYCACIGKTVGEMFANDPSGENAASQRGQDHYQGLAVSQCKRDN